MNPISDYTDRLNILNPKELERFEKAKADLEKYSGSSQSFEKLLREEVNKKIEGKVPSSSVSIPKNIKDEVKTDPYKKKLYNASVEFESIFVKMMLSQMKKSVNKSGLISGGHAEEIFEDMLYDEYAKKISQSENLGLAEQIYTSLSASLPDSKKQ
ncbi:MAG: rod-binding protein [Leptospiraceae bacterium]|nr:rod-binding protein [Leptospiraceae bacterium]MCP5500372.1 rod-binding protein [Leptospiraceae bacterium]